MRTRNFIVLGANRRLWQVWRWLREGLVQQCSVFFGGCGQAVNLEMAGCRPFIRGTPLRLQTCPCRVLVRSECAGRVQVEVRPARTQDSALRTIESITAVLYQLERSSKPCSRTIGKRLATHLGRNPTKTATRRAATSATYMPQSYWPILGCTTARSNAQPYVLRSLFVHDWSLLPRNCRGLLARLMFC